MRLRLLAAACAGMLVLAPVAAGENPFLPAKRLPPAPVEKPAAVPVPTVQPTPAPKKDPGRLKAVINGIEIRYLSDEARYEFRSATDSNGAQN